MASRRELQRLEDENRTLCQRLADMEVDLSRKEDELKAASMCKCQVGQKSFQVCGYIANWDEMGYSSIHPLWNILTPLDILYIIYYPLDISMTTPWTDLRR